MGLVKEIVFLLCSVIIGLMGTGTVAYMTLFVMDVHLSFLPLPTIDGSPYYSPPCHPSASPLLNNLFFLIVFALQHSFMVRGPMRRVLDLFIAEDGIRLAFVLAASVCLFSLFLFWFPMPYKVWDIQQQQLRVVVFGINILCWMAVVYTLLTLDPFSLLGIKPLMERILKKKSEVHFVTSGVYGLMRHPSYSFLFLSIWITPTMSIGHVLFSSVIMVYTMLAVAYLEEPDLIKIVGPRYSDYMKTTPRYIPCLSCPVSRTDKEH